jgi:hypothetical protein
MYIICIFQGLKVKYMIHSTVRWKYSSLFVLFAFLFIHTLSYSSEITFNSSFECGNATSFTLVSENEFNFEIEPDTNSTDRQWYYFIVSGANGRTLTFNITNIGRTNVRRHWRDSLPVASHDGAKTWQRVSGPSSSTRRTFTFSHACKSDTVHIAYYYPYSWTRLQQKVAEWASDSNVELSLIGSSIQGRDIYMLKITDENTNQDKEFGFWIVARQHAGEVTGSWMLEGFLEFLLSEDPQAQWIRKHCVTNVVPMVNPDGVVAGNYRDNFKGVNLNRVWNSATEHSSPEILSVTRVIDSWVAEGNPYDFFADLHSTSGASNHYAYYASEGTEPPLYKNPESYYEDSVAILNLINKYNPGFNNTRGESSSMSQRLSRQHQMMQYGVLALIFESGYTRIGYGPRAEEYSTPAHHKSVGQALARALAEYYSTLSNVEVE